MNFYFFIQMGCPLQDSFTPTQFIERLGLAAAIHADEQANNVDPENPRSGDAQRLIAVRLDGAERMIKRAEVCEMHDDFLGTARLHCMHCPVNKTHLPLACVGMLALPLGERAEAWLLGQFAPPEPERSTVAALLRASRFPERRHARLLGAGGEVRKTLAPGGAEVSSTQLFYLLLNLKPLSLELRLRLAWEFGVIKAKAAQVEELSGLIAAATEAGAGDAAERLGAVRRAAGRIKVKLKYEKGDDEQIGMLKQYFLLGWQSLETGVALHASLM